MRGARALTSSSGSFPASQLAARVGGGGGAITAQQVNLTFAFSLRASLVRRFGTKVPFDGATLYALLKAWEHGDPRRPI